MSVYESVNGKQNSKSADQVFSLSYDAASGWSAPFPAVDSERTLVVIFAACNTPDQWQPIAEVIAAFPNSKLVGCGSNTVIAEGQMLSESVSVGIMQFRDAEVRVAIADIPSFDDSRSAGESIGAVLADENLKGVLVFADNDSTDATALVAGLQQTLPPQVAIGGGLSGASIEAASVRSWVLCDGKIRPRAACAVGLIGNAVEVVPSTGGGWMQIGKESRATLVEGRTIREIDSRPALEVYLEYVRQDNPEVNLDRLVNYPIAVKTEGLEMQIVRDIVGVDEKTNSILLADGIPSDAVLRVMKSNVEEILDGVEEAVDRLRSRTILPKANSLCICISCLGRKVVLGDQTENEARVAQAGLGQGINTAGFYAYGEIASTSNGSPYVHNQTMALILLREF